MLFPVGFWKSLEAFKHSLVLVQIWHYLTDWISLGMNAPVPQTLRPPHAVQRVLTHRGQDGRFQDDQGHFGLFSIVGETLDFHHVELVLGLGSQTHLEKTAQLDLHNTAFMSEHHHHADVFLFFSPSHLSLLFIHDHMLTFQDLI